MLLNPVDDGNRVGTKMYPIDHFKTVYHALQLELHLNRFATAVKAHEVESVPKETFESIATAKLYVLKVEDKATGKFLPLIDQDKLIIQASVDIAIAEAHAQSRSLGTVHMFFVEVVFSLIRNHKVSKWEVFVSRRLIFDKL